MPTRILLALLLAAGCCLGHQRCEARQPLAVVADFEGGSVSGVEIDQSERSIRFMPGGDPARGWPCWWNFRVDGIAPGETITLRLRGSTATLPPEYLEPPMVELRDRFMKLAYARISRLKPLIPMSNKPKVAGPGYHPLWRQISANWVSLHGNPHTVSLCLETIWNYQHSTTDGYRAVGASLAAAVREYLAERPLRAGGDR